MNQKEYFDKNGMTKSPPDIVCGSHYGMVQQVMLHAAVQQSEFHCPGDTKVI